MDNLSVYKSGIQMRKARSVLEVMRVADTIQPTWYGYNDIDHMAPALASTVL